MSMQSEDAQLILNAQRIRVGVVLATVGAVIGAVGSILAGVELATATRKWLSASGHPPSEEALNKVHQAMHASRAARHAAREAWLHNGDVVTSGVPTTATGPS